MTIRNKRGLSKLTQREINAIKTSCFETMHFPAELIRKRLENEGKVTFTNLDDILTKVHASALTVRLYTPVSGKELEPKQVIKLAADLIDVMDELDRRLNFTPHELDTLVASYLDESGLDIWACLASMRTSMNILREGFQHAHSTLVKRGSRRGPRPTPWTDARQEISSILGSNAQPPLSEKTRGALAAELLELCDLPQVRKQRSDKKR